MNSPFDRTLGRWQKIKSPEEQKAEAMALDMENLGDLNNLGHDEITEDFADSPHADRVEVEDEGELIDDPGLSTDGSAETSASD